METKKCPNCHHLVKANVTFCPYCGYKFALQTKKEEAKAAKHRKQTSQERKPKQLFCPNCGHPVKAGADFCSNCGFDLKHRSKPKTQSSKIQSPLRKRQREEKAKAPAPKIYKTKKLSTKAKTIISVVAVLLVAFIGFYIWGSNHYSKNNQIDRMAAVLGNPKEDLSPYVMADTQNMKVTKENVKPLQEYYHDHQTAVTKMTQNMKDGIDPNAKISLVKNGHYLLLFPKYVLQVKTYQPQVITNHSNSVVTVNGKNIGTLSNQNGKYYKKLGLVFPGKYYFAVKSKVAGRNLNATSTTNIWNNKTLNMEIRTQTFRVKSVPNGVVYIDDKKVGTLDSDGEKTFKSYPVTKDMKLYVTYKKLKSEVVNNMAYSFGFFTDDYSDSGSNGDDFTNDADYENDGIITQKDGLYLITPEWQGLIDKDDAKSLLDGDYSDPDDSDFTGGSANKGYQELKQQADRWNGDKFDGFEAETTISSIFPAGKNESRVSYRVNYTIHTDDYDLKQVVEYPGAILVKDGDNYLIKNLGDGKLISSHKENAD